MSGWVGQGGGNAPCPLTRLPGCPPPAAVACTCVWFSRCWTLPRGHLPVPCVGTGEAARGASAPAGAVAGPLAELTGRAAGGPGHRSPGTAHQLSASCPSSAPPARVSPRADCGSEQTVYPASHRLLGPRPPPSARDPPLPPHEHPLQGVVGPSCFLSLKPSRDTGQTAPSLQPEAHPNPAYTPRRASPEAPWDLHRREVPALEAGSCHMDSVPCRSKARGFFPAQGGPSSAGVLGTS